MFAYKDIREGGAITMFIGFFVAVLFFFFACSMTYFKWFNDKEQDRIQFKSLKRIGMTDKEIRKIAIRQMGVIFFIPILIGSIHSGVALHTLGKMLYIDLWKSGALVIGAYILASAIYFMIAQRGYLKHVKAREPLAFAYAVSYRRTIDEHLATSAQNIKGNWRNYKVFFLSSCFAIFASYAYMSVIVHPYMQETMWYQNVRWGLIICNVIIISFFVIFILYSTSIFIEARKKN